MKKFNADDALKGAPVKLKNGLKAYIKKYREDNVFAYSGYVAGEKGEVKSWNRQGKEYFNCESSYDIVAMWEDEEQEANAQANAQANLEAESKANVEDNLEDNLEASENTDESTFEKALDGNLPLRHITQRADVPNFYCIAKTRDGDYILERENRGTKLIARLSSLTEDLDWYIVEPARPVVSIPKAFIPKVGEAFWYVSPTYHPFVRHKVYKEDNQNIIDTVANGAAFRTKEDAVQMLLLLRQNIEHNNEEK